MIAMAKQYELNGLVEKRVGSRGLARKASLFGLGLAALVVGGFPVWAARRILYPPWAEQLPDSEDVGLDFEDGVVAERVEFESVTGHRLSGWFVPGPEESAKPWPVVLLVYGYGGYKEQMVAYARIIRAGGFATLMFDMQGSGLRRGEPVTLGFKERWDLMGAARYLQTRPDVDPEAIGVFGVSMGAATAILAAAEEPAIKAIVSDSGYADVVGMIRPGLAAFVGRFSHPFAPLIVRIAEAMIGTKASEIVPERAAAELGNRPLLVIHGDQDALVSPESAGRLYAAASGPKELWVVPECAHGRGPEVAPDEYQERVNGFFARWLTGEPAHELTAMQAAS
jgi:dipeptidyl aminopeptidase/acylaminoacyl peptidase